MKTISEIFHLFLSYQFTSSVIDAQAAADLCFRQGYTLDQAARRLTNLKDPSLKVTGKQVRDCLDTNCRGELGLQKIAALYSETIYQYFLDRLLQCPQPIDESFLPDDVPDKTYLLCILSAVFEVLPTVKNMYVPNSHPSKFDTVEKKSAFLTEAKSYVLFDELLADAYFKSSKRRLNLFHCILSRRKTFQLRHFRDKLFLLRNKHEGVVRLLFDHVKTPVSADNFNKLLKEETGKNVKSPVTMLDKQKGIYRLNATLFGKECDLTYPDHLDEIRSRIRKMVEQDNLRTIDKVVENLVSDFPRLKSRHEIKSIVRTINGIKIVNKTLLPEPKES